jgi:hypothetical protein
MARSYSLISGAVGDGHATPFRQSKPGLKRDCVANSITRVPSLIEFLLTLIRDGVEI